MHARSSSPTRAANSHHHKRRTDMFKLPKLAGVVVCAALGFSTVAQADAVTDWNAITMDAVTIARPGPQGMLDVALVHVAVHDAIQSIEKRYEPYHFQLKDAKGSRTAAAVAAAHGVLVAIYPT